MLGLFSGCWLGSKVNPGTSGARSWEDLAVRIVPGLLGSERIGRPKVIEPARIRTYAHIFNMKTLGDLGLGRRSGTPPSPHAPATTCAFLTYKLMPVYKK